MNEADREAGSRDLRSPKRWDAPDPWETAPDALAEMGLMDVLNSPRFLAELDASEGERHQIRLHEAPPGFRALMGKLADELFLSYSALSRAALGHGIEILESQRSISQLRAAYEQMRRRGMDLGDADALTRLNLTTRYSFQQPRSVATTLDASKATAARVSDLAMLCGISRATLAVIAISKSLLTLGNNRLYRTHLEKEVAAFARFVVRRTQELKFEDPS